MSYTRFLYPDDPKQCCNDALINLLSQVDAEELRKELIKLITEQGITHNQRALVAEAAQRSLMQLKDLPERLKTYLSSELGEPYPLPPESQS